MATSRRTKTSLTHKYTPRLDQYENNLFMEEYYSSTDTQIYFINKGKVKKQSQIGYIAYNIQEQVKPLYGYASRTWDDVAIGTRVVTGQFTMPIKNPDENSRLNEVDKELSVRNTSGNASGKKNKKVKNLEYNEEQNKKRKQKEWAESSSNKGIKKKKKSTNKGAGKNLKAADAKADVNPDSSSNTYSPVLDVKHKEKTNSKKDNSSSDSSQTTLYSRTRNNKYYKLLSKLGYLTEGINIATGEGYISRDIDTAISSGVKKFQKDYDIEANGELTDETKEAILEVWDGYGK